MASSEPQAKKSKFAHRPANGKSKFYKAPGANRPQFLEVGQRGFLATTNFREKECVRECYNILNGYADELYGSERLDYADEEAAEPEATADAGKPDEDDDIATQLAQNIDTLKAEQSRANKRRRFQQVNTGASNCVFIRTALRDPVRLATHIVRDVRLQRRHITRNVLRFIPVEAVCKANLLDIRNAAGLLFDRHMLNAPADTYAIVYNKRCNNDLNRDELIRELASLVEQKNAGFKVDLKSGNVAVLVEVVKGLCCLAVVRDYLQLRKYNLTELASEKTDAKAEVTTEVKAETAVAEEAEDVKAEPVVAVPETEVKAEDGVDEVPVATVTEGQDVPAGDK